ncbi:MAG: hypothetical protein IPP48_05535 [Chitinophagaceae bacterium]|nr:hypothetical protein [Chitinophagaceae bacterium]
MELDSIENVSIIGLKKVFIIYKDSLRFGTFGLTDGKIPEELDLFNPSSKKE